MYKQHNQKERLEKCFTGYLSADRKRYVEFTEIEKTNLKGMVLAALTD